MPGFFHPNTDRQALPGVFLPMLIIKLLDYQMLMLITRSMSVDGQKALPSARLLSSSLLSKSASTLTTKSASNLTTLTANVMQVDLETCSCQSGDRN